MMGTEKIPKLSKEGVLALQKRFSEALGNEPWPLQCVLDRADGVVKTGEHQYKALCPCHDDTNPSLSIDYDRESEKVLLYCHACGSEKQYANFLTAWGLDPAELVIPEAPFNRKIVATYDYTDENRNLLYQNVRYEPKDFRQRQPDGNGGWIWSLNGVRPVLYKLPELIEAKTPEVYVVEGEKDVETLRRHGLIATTSGGATSWRSEFNEYFKGRHVIIVPDNDKAGEEYANRVASELFDVAATVRIFNLPHGKDVSDYLQLGGRIDHLACDVRNTPLVETRPAYTGGPNTIWLDEVELKEVLWLWPYRIPLGKLTLLAGEAGIGKSLLTLDIAARVSTGTAWPDDTGKPDIGSVLICTSEDDTEDTIGVRLFAAGALLGKIAHVKNIFSIKELIVEAEKILKSRQDVSLIIMDPITEFLGDADSNKTSDVRRALVPLTDFAAEHNIAVLAVTHYAKAERTSAANKIIGSQAFNAVARQVWHVLEDGSQRLFVAGKANLTGRRTGLAYTVEDTTVNFKGKELRAVKVNIEPDPVCETAQDILDHQNHKPSKVEIAEEFLELQLAEGPKDQKKIKEMAYQKGITDYALSKARDELNIEIKPVGKGKTRKSMWSLP